METATSVTERITLTQTTRGSRDDPRGVLRASRPVDLNARCVVGGASCINKPAAVARRLASSAAFAELDRMAVGRTAFEPITRYSLAEVARLRAVVSFGIATIPSAATRPEHSHLGDDSPRCGIKDFEPAFDRSDVSTERAKHRRGAGLFMGTLKPVRATKAAGPAPTIEGIFHRCAHTSV